MVRATTRLLLACVLLLSAALGGLLLQPVQSTAELDTDLTSVAAQIKQANLESERYRPNLIKTMIELRTQTFKNTQAMLQQKRMSILRGLRLSYVISGNQVAPATQAQLAEITKDIKSSEEKLVELQSQAAQYSGGLVQAMALMSVETERVTISQLWLKYYSAKYGLANFKISPDAKESVRPPGHVVKDKDAL
jgi:hypothetical protein